MLSIFNLFSIGIGPSSSHTVGPMRAAKTFVEHLQQHHHLSQVTRLTIELFGSLAFTGKGHGTDHAILLGLEGKVPDTVNPDGIKPRATTMIEDQHIRLLNSHTISFNYA